MWFQTMLQRFASMLQSVIESWKRANPTSDPSEHFSQILDWIIWFLQNASVDEGIDNLDEFPELM